MNTLRRFDMTAEQLERLLDACQPVPAIMLQCGMPPSPQEKANNAWRRLGEEMGFKHTTVNPIAGQPQTAFLAEPDDTGEPPPGDK